MIKADSKNLSKGWIILEQKYKPWHIYLVNTYFFNNYCVSEIVLNPKMQTLRTLWCQSFHLLKHTRKTNMLGNKDENPSMKSPHSTRVQSLSPEHFIGTLELRLLGKESPNKGTWMKGDCGTEKGFLYRKRDLNKLRWW